MLVSHAPNKEKQASMTKYVYAENIVTAKELR